MRNKPDLFLCAGLAALLAIGIGGAFGAPPDSLPKPFVSPIFGDNMVLQRDKPNPIWGWSQPGDSVRVEIGGKSAQATAGADGRWEVRIDPPPTGGPYMMKIAGRQSVVLHEVLVGDVWLCAGQSNMQFNLTQARNGADEIKNANHPLIRIFNVGEKVAYTRQKVPRGGSWRIVFPSALGTGRGGGMSAVAYFFARRLQEDVNIPIGLVEVAVGGVPAETLASPESMRAVGDFDAGIAEMEGRAKAGDKEYGNYLNHWLDENDIGSKNGSWADPAMDDGSWKNVAIMGDYRELGIADKSLIWLRKEITLPDPLPSGAARLSLGSVDKMDTAYINGQQVGASSWVENPRNYFARDLKPGRNVIAIRLFRSHGGASFISSEDQLRLTIGDKVFPLAGEWKAKVAVDGVPGQKMPLGYENLVSMPGVLYHGMVEPILPLALTGAIWYQGESNAERAQQYRMVLPAMIAGWRKAFGQGDFPFYIVSLPFYQHRREEPGSDSWAEAREAQALTAKSVPHSCLAITIDTGDADNVHPIDKVQAGDRLAYCALAEHYGFQIPYSGPAFSSVDRMPGALRVHFDHTEGGLIVKGERLGEFSVAGEDHKWHWAEARIEGSTVIVSSKLVPDPRFVRYAWQSNPLATLFNGAGLPAAPFRTDDFPGVTDGKKIR